MQIVTPSDVEEIESRTDVVVRLLAAGARMNLQHVVFGPGTEGDLHHHPHEQLVYVTQGRLVYRTEDEEFEVEAGDSIAIPGDEPHAAINRTDEPAACVEVFSPARETPPWAE